MTPFPSFAGCHLCNEPMHADHTCEPNHLISMIHIWEERAHCLDDLLTLEREANGELKRKLANADEHIKNLEESDKEKDQAIGLLNATVDTLKPFMELTTKYIEDVNALSKITQPTRPTGWQCQKCRCIWSLEEKTCKACTENE